MCDQHLTNTCLLAHKSTVMNESELAPLPIIAVWNPSYSVGSTLLDSQHRKLLKLCAALGNSLLHPAANGRHDFHEILHELSEYSRQHFAAEEALLGKHGYPQLADQKSDHLEYCRQIAEQSFAASTGEADQLSLQRFVTEWWTHHILESDMAYRDFLISRGAS